MIAVIVPNRHAAAYEHPLASSFAPGHEWTRLGAGVAHLSCGTSCGTTATPPGPCSADSPAT